MPAAPELSSPTSLITNLPPSRNFYFVGRRDLLDNLERSFTSEETRQTPQVISGMSGIGKTAAAVEYALSRRHLYDLIWFLHAETPASLAADMGRLAARLSPSSGSPNDFLANCRAVHRALRVRSRWLLIFDDANSSQEIASCLPWKSSGNVLITSRKADWKPLANSIHLSPWRREDSVAFLKLHIPEMRDAEIADKLGLLLGDLPMALEQAAAYIKLAGIRPEDYLRAYEGQWAEMLVRGKTGAEFPNAGALAWELSFKQMKSQHPTAVDLLTLCSFLGAEQIPFAIIADARKKLPESLEEFSSDRAKLIETASILQEFSLAQIWDDGLIIHCLTAAQARNRLTPPERAMWAATAMDVAASAFPFDSQNPTFWPQCAQSLPHVLQAAAHAQAADVAPMAIADLLDKAGWFLLKQAQYAHAQKVLETALQLVKEKLGPATTMAARVANNLGRARQRMGDSAGAMALYESAMEIDSFRYGPTTPHMATAANNFGMTLAATGQPQRARERFEWALTIFTDHYGEEHFKVASVLNNLGFVLAELKLPEEANSSFRKAMRIVEKSHGNHPNLACIALNLGCLLQSQGHTVEAGQLLEQALQIDETKLGINHPRVAHDLGKIAQFHESRGDRPLAINFLERARQIIESNYGPESPLLIPYLKELARCFKAIGNVDQLAELANRLAAIEGKRANVPAVIGDGDGFEDGVLSE